MDFFKILRQKGAKSIKKNIDYRETTAEDIMISPMFFRIACENLYVL